MKKSKNAKKGKIVKIAKKARITFLFGAVLYAVTMYLLTQFNEKRKKQGRSDDVCLDDEDDNE